MESAKFIINQSLDALSNLNAIDLGWDATNVGICGISDPINKCWEKRRWWRRVKVHFELAVSIDVSMLGSCWHSDAAGRCDVWWGENGNFGISKIPCDSERIKAGKLAPNRQTRCWLSCWLRSTQ
jgi:hypothetical protein